MAKRGALLHSGFLHARQKNAHREAEVMRHLASGNGIAEIGREMGLSPKTDKLELRSDAALIRYAVVYQIIEAGWSTKNSGYLSGVPSIDIA
nr:LuxR C-terminal-related transcriptional regulator [Burkholderia contaminans]